MSVNGQDPRSNVYLLDGTLQNDFTNGPAGQRRRHRARHGDVREFRVETNAYSAEFGRNSGGQINVLTKSGTNDFHGSAVSSSTATTTSTRATTSTPQASPEFKRNQFGGTRRRTDRSATARSSSSATKGLRERLGKTISDDRAGRQRPARHPPDRRDVRRQPGGRALIWTSTRVPNGASRSARGLAHLQLSASTQTLDAALRPGPHRPQF